MRNKDDLIRGTILDCNQQPMLRKILKFIRNVTLGVSLVLLGIWVYVAQPSFRSSERLDLDVNEARFGS